MSLLRCMNQNVAKCQRAFSKALQMGINWCSMALVGIILAGCVQEEPLARSPIMRSSEPEQQTVGSAPSATVGANVSNYLPTSADQRKRIALIIGNSSYVNVQTLRNPANDAKDISNALRRLGFQVDEQENVTDSRTMRDLVRQFGEKLHGGGVGLFYYSGHGIQVKGDNYLIPVNANIKAEADADYEALSMKYVQSTLDDAGNGMNIVILDACRDNPFTRSIRGSSRGLSGGLSRGLAQIDSASGSLIAFSTAPGSTAEDGSGRNGTYTKNLLANIDTAGIPVEALFKRVRVGVNKDTGGKQTPWESSSLTGEFCFAGCSDAIAASSKAEAAKLHAREEELLKELEKQKSAAAAAIAQAEKLRNAVKEGGNAPALTKTSLEVEGLNKRLEEELKRNREQQQQLETIQMQQKAAQASANDLVATRHMDQPQDANSSQPAEASRSTKKDDETFTPNF